MATVSGGHQRLGHAINGQPVQLRDTPDCNRQIPSAWANEPAITP